jgi:hypothetical protein
VTPSNCDATTYANAPDWYTGPWYLIPGYGFCPADAATDLSVLDFGKKWGFDDLQVVVYNDCLSFRDKTNWTNIDEDNLSNGYASNLDGGAQKWIKGFICVIAATCLLGAAYLLLILPCIGKSNKCGNYTISFTVSISLTTAYALYISAYLFIWNTDQLEEEAWSTSFFETCDVEIERDYGALIAIIVTLTAVLGCLTVAVWQIIYALDTKRNSRKNESFEDKTSPQKMVTNEEEDHVVKAFSSMKNSKVEKVSRQKEYSALDKYCARNNLVGLTAAQRLELANRATYIQVQLVSYVKPVMESQDGSSEENQNNVFGNMYFPSVSSERENDLKNEDECSDEESKGSPKFTEFGTSTRSGMSPVKYDPMLSASKKEVQPKTGLEGYNGPKSFEVVIGPQDSVQEMMKGIVDSMNEGRNSALHYRATQIIVSLEGRILKDSEIACMCIGDTPVQVAVNPYVGWTCEVLCTNESDSQEYFVKVSSRATFQDVSETLASVIGNGIQPSQIVLRYNDRRLYPHDTLFGRGVGHNSSLTFKLFQEEEVEQKNDLEITLEPLSDEEGSPGDQTSGFVSPSSICNAFFPIE